MTKTMTKTMPKTMNVTLGTMLAAALLLPSMASANGSDVAYCGALVQKYERHLAGGSAKSRPPQSLEAREAVERCKAGDTSGIPTIEKALENARFTLPSRG
jgi:hypothetical protein